MTDHNRNNIEFINIVNHEMRTPIQSILTYAELLCMQSEKKMKEHAQAIFRNAMRLQTLSNNLLDVTRIENQTLKLKKEKFDLIELISSVIGDYRNLIENSPYDTKDIKLLLESRDQIILKADRDRLAQVIINLVDNAFKFTEKGSIRIIVEKKDADVAVITVKDTGSGIDPQILYNLFSKFTTLSVKGTGLGLFISKNIVEAHGGKIWAENNTEEKGTSFIFIIPIAIQKNEKTA